MENAENVKTMKFINKMNKNAAKNVEFLKILMDNNVCVRRGIIELTEDAENAKATKSIHQHNRNAVINVEHIKLITVRIAYVKMDTI